MHSLNDGKFLLSTFLIARARKVIASEWRAIMNPETSSDFKTILEKIIHGLVSLRLSPLDPALLTILPSAFLCFDLFLVSKKGFKKSWRNSTHLMLLTTPIAFITSRWRWRKKGSWLISVLPGVTSTTLTCRTFTRIWFSITQVLNNLNNYLLQWNCLLGCYWFMRVKLRNCLGRLHYK